jgi:RNA polymerase sigma-70 factor (ECF subfamily)
MDGASLSGLAVPDTAQGQYETFERLIQPLMEAGFALAVAMLHDREAAEDAIQEALLKSWRHLPKLDDLDAPPRAWFLTVVANQCRDARRAPWRRVLRFGSPPAGIQTDHAERVTRDLDLTRSMARLPPEARALLYLRYAQDMSPSEIARVLSIRLGTVKSRLHRALRKLEAHLEETP